HHIEAITPPDIVVVRRLYLIFHYLKRAGNLDTVRRQIVQIYIGLKTSLIVSEQNKILRIAIGRIFPFLLIVAFSSLPLILLCPVLRVFAKILITRQKISFHISRVVCGIMPERVCSLRIVFLPISIDLINNFFYFFC